ncbi:entericidin A/B family lipoprotein [Hafnia paralvei]
MIKKSISLVCSLLVLAALAGCNTTRGAGEDVEAGGQAIQRAAQ